MTKQFIKGAGGGSKKQHIPVETPNSLITKTTARVVFLTSQGEVMGLCDQPTVSSAAIFPAVKPLKAVFMDNIAVQNTDDTLHYANATAEERVGLPSQTAIAGFPSATTGFSVGTKVVVATPVAYTSSTADVDAIRVGIRFPALFQQENNGDINKTTVEFGIYRRLGAGSYSLIRTVTVNDKTNAPSDIDYLIERPTGAGTWGVRVNRVTADNSLSTLANDIYFQTATELRYVTLPFNNRALVGLKVVADETTSRYPVVGFDIAGIKCKIPSNYNPYTRVNSGGWDGTFKAQKDWTCNPAWVLYDVLTNTRYGMGIAEADIDKFSFYDAAVYNDATVPALVNGAVSGTEPRYQFHHQFLDGQDDGWSFVQNLAATFGAVVYSNGTQVKLVQDRVTNWSRVVSNSNVIDGMFEYSSSTLQTRTTACICYWQNPDEGMLATPAYYEDTAATTRYGYNLKEVQGIGVTTEGQAHRLAKWNVETSISNLTSVTFKVGFANAGLMPGEVIKIADADYAEVMSEARAVSATSSVLTIDRPVSVVSGNTFDIIGADGTTVLTRTVSGTSTDETVPYSGSALSITAGATVIFTTDISPRYFKVISVKEEQPGEWSVSAVQYDPNKFGRVDDTPTGAPLIYQQPNQIPSAPTALNFREVAVNDNNSIRRSLIISWSRPVSGGVSGYALKYRVKTSSWTLVNPQTTSYEIAPVIDGTYEVEVRAVNARGVASDALTGSYSISINGVAASPLDPPTNLIETNLGATVFTSDNLNFRWTNPTSNGSKSVSLRDFEVRIIETTGSTTLRTFYIAPIAAGQNQQAAYTYEDNRVDGGPRRTIKVQVRCRDTNNNLSNAVETTFTNPAPGVPYGITVQGGVGNVKMYWQNPTESDFEGTLIWRSTTTGFTPSYANLVFDGSDAAWTDGAVTDGTRYYYRFAAYDSFEKTYDGARLNLTGEYTGDAVSLDFDTNLVHNSSFQALTPEGNFKPTGFYTYEFAEPPRHEFFDATGRNSSKAFASRIITAVPSQFGLATLPSEVPGGASVNGGWKTDTDYVLSIYAKRVNGSGWTNLEPVWNNIPDAQTVLSAPNLTTSWVRSSWKIRWDAGSTVEPDGGFFIRVNGTHAVGAELHLDDIQVEVGTAVTAYAPRSSELVLPGSITATEIADDSVTTPKLVAGSVVAGKIAADAVGTNELIAGAVTADKIAANSITADKVVITGTAAALNADPNTQDGSAWTSDAADPTVITDTTSPTGKALELNSSAAVLTTEFIPLDATKNYNLRTWFKQQSGTSTTYLAVAFYNGSQGLLTGTSNPSGWTDYGTFHYYGLVNATGPASWSEYRIDFGPDETAHIPTGAKFCRIGVLFNESGTGVQRTTNLRLVEKVSSALIVNGAITATKIAVSSLDAVSATIGTLRTASSGQRVEIKDNQIIVYDSSNAVRVKIGNLS